MQEEFQFQNSTSEELRGISWLMLPASVAAIQHRSADAGSVRHVRFMCKFLFSTSSNTELRKLTTDN